ncbi:hypothetical protein M758_UG172900 [Ceratodon purpureus]|nr:hypothetical protein M758_UG172900 [Ceratodon purpureus]
MCHECASMWAAYGVTRVRSEAHSAVREVARCGNRLSVAENTGDEWSCAYVRSPGRGNCEEFR